MNALLLPIVPASVGAEARAPASEYGCVGHGASSRPLVLVVVASGLPRACDPWVGVTDLVGDREPGQVADLSS